MLPIWNLIRARDFVVKSFGGSIKFVCQGEGSLLFCPLSNNVEITEQPLKKSNKSGGGAYERCEGSDEVIK